MNVLVCGILQWAGSCYILRYECSINTVRFINQGVG